VNVGFVFFNFICLITPLQFCGDKRVKTIKVVRQKGSTQKTDTQKGDKKWADSKEISDEGPFTKGSNDQVLIGP